MAAWRALNQWLERCPRWQLVLSTSGFAFAVGFTAGLLAEHLLRGQGGLSGPLGEGAGLALALGFASLVQRNMRRP